MEAVQSPRLITRSKVSTQKPKHQYLQEPGGPVLDLSKLTRPGLAKGKTLWSTRSRRPSTQVPASGDASIDLSTITQSSLQGSPRNTPAKSEHLLDASGKLELSMVIRSERGTPSSTPKQGYRSLDASPRFFEPKLELSQVTRPSLLQGSTLMSTRQSKTLPHSSFLEPGSPVLELAATTRPGLAKGKTFLSISQGESPRYSVMTEAGSPTAKLAEILRPGLGQGKSIVSGRTTEFSPRLCWQEGGASKVDLSLLTRSHLSSGKTFMHSRSFDDSPRYFLRGPGGSMLDLKGIVRPGLAHGKTFVASYESEPVFARTRTAKG